MYKSYNLLLIVTLFVVTIIPAFAGENTVVGSPTTSRIAMQFSNLSSFSGPTNQIGLYGISRLQQMMLGGESASSNSNLERVAQNLNKRPTHALKRVKIDTIERPVLIRHNNESIQISDVERIKLLNGQEILIEQNGQDAKFHQNLLDQIDYLERSNGEVIFPTEIQQAL
ncbi:MAG: hypothetical protein HN353_06655 [Bdellovibrionales bacterium]|jgi:hypothetical protein|nr:hypothetical protein [Bdellovibrionales bacterium]MBT3526433.1 hypothetical protein [Bdellovibrionales bacterium]MBT7669971.1 hypothetical protein [Bdellovibrionales bacterium]MBT7765703.1 hypothetical protein [Bdellovibrionales bacterium]